MIRAVIIVNKSGKPRLIKFFDNVPLSEQQRIVKETYLVVSRRPDNVCNFLNASEILDVPDVRLVYRQYALLYFIFFVDSTESELGILDLIQVFVETLDECFSGVNELDIIFHVDKVHQVLAEFVMGGLVLQVDKVNVLGHYNAQQNIEQKENKISRIPANAMSAVREVDLVNKLRKVSNPNAMNHGYSPTTI